MNRSDNTPEELTPPRNLDAEQVVLGCCLFQTEAAQRAATMLTEQDFYQEAHRHIWRAVQDGLAAAQPACDLIVVCNGLRRAGLLEGCGGAEYLTAIMGMVPTIGHLRRYARIVLRCSLYRQLILASAELQRGAYAEKPELEILLATTRDALDVVTRRLASETLQYVTASQAGAMLSRTMWLWPGWVPRGYVSMIAGEAGIGKSALVLRLAAAATGQVPWPDNQPPPSELKPVLWLDTEGTQALLCERIAEWNIDGSRIIMPGVDGVEQIMLDGAAGIDRLQALIEATGAGLVVVDSLATAHSGDENSAEMRTLLASLAQVARDNEVAVLLVHHPRKRNQMEGTEVTLDRLRGSSTVGALCRVIFAIDRPDAEDSRKRVTVIKSNLAKAPAALGYTQDDSAWLDFCAAPEIYHALSPAEEAYRWLDGLLDKGALPYAQIIAARDARGITERDFGAAVKRVRPEISRGTSGNEWRKPTGASGGTDRSGW